MSEENKAIVRRFYDEFISQGNVDTFDELASPNVIEHEDLGDLPRTGEGVKQMFAMFRAAFPDLRGTIDDLIVEGDKVVVRATWTGSHKGEFMGIPPSDQFVTFKVIDILRIENGKIAEHWGLSDNMALMQQIGAIPSQ